MSSNTGSGEPPYPTIISSNPLSNSAPQQSPQQSPEQPPGQSTESAHRQPFYLWTDIETTGLIAHPPELANLAYKTNQNPERDQILEIAFVLTDENCGIISTYHTILIPPKFLNLLTEMEDIVYEMHMQSGLLLEILYELRASKPPFSRITGLSVNTEIQQWFSANGVLPERKLFLAGNSVYFDRQFLLRDYPSLEKYLHYRQLDVSSIRIMLESKLGHKIEWSSGDTEKSHRAMADVHESIEQYVYYFNMLPLHRFEVEENLK